jgi:hypothetical protein
MPSSLEEMLRGEGARVGLGLLEVINHNQKVAKWVRSWSVMQLVPVEEIDNVVDASLAFYNESVM